MTWVVMFWLPAASWGTAANFRTRTRHAADLAPDGVVIALGQRAGAAEPETEPAAADVAGKDQDDVASEVGDLGFNLRFGAIADADHGNDGAHADDDAQHGQQRAQSISAQRPQGNF